MKPLTLIDLPGGRFSLLLNAGDTPVDARIMEKGHEPNGYFWEGVAQLLVGWKAKELEGRFDYDPEAGMFCAYGSDKAALEALGSLMAAVANDVAEIDALLAHAAEIDFEFDD